MKSLIAVLGAAILAGCGGNPLGNVPASTPAPTTTGLSVPASSAGNLISATYNPTAGSLTVDLRSLDGSTQNQVYTRNPAFDIAGYTAFT